MAVGDYFDRYWRSMNTFVSDARSLEKARIVHRMLGEINGPVLDAGCGRGVVAAYLIERGRRIAAFDASEVAVGHARSLGVEASVLDLEKNDPPGQYAAALCLDILQHSPHPLALLGRISRATVGGGKMIVSLPNEFHLLRRLGILFGRFRFARYDGPHPRLFWKAEALRLVEDAGLKVESVVPMALTAPRHRAASPIGRLMARAAPSLMAIGFIIEARKVK